MKKRWLSVVCVMAILASLSVINVRASEQMVDGSYLTNDTESVGEAVLVMRGEDLQTGTSKVSKSSSTSISAGGTTGAKHVVDEIGVAVAVERLKVGTSSWSFYRSWQATKTDAAFVSSSKRLTVPTGYYYRVRCTHWANSDVSTSSTSGILLD